MLESATKLVEVNLNGIELADTEVAELLVKLLELDDETLLLDKDALLDITLLLEELRVATELIDDAAVELSGGVIGGSLLLPPPPPPQAVNKKATPMKKIDWYNRISDFLFVSVAGWDD